MCPFYQACHYQLALTFLSCLVPAFNMDCSMTFRGTHDDVSQGYLRYPVHDRRQQNCSYVIIAPRDYVISLEFLDVRFSANGSDCTTFVSISGAGRNQKLCRKDDFTSLSIMSTTLIMLVLTESGNFPSVSLTARYTTQKQDCNMTHMLKPGDKGTVTSPAYPITYPQNIFCVTHLRTTSSDFRVRLVFNNSFHIEDSRDCRKDYLKIVINEHKDGDPANNESTYFLLCGRTSPQEIISQGNIDVIFSSDSQRTYQGFSLTYEYIQGVPCSSGSMFSCTDMECIPRYQICDGTAQCSNARDEYCGNNGDTSEPCFLCGDGRCIRPFPPPTRGATWHKMWWICDGISHCPDGTDEQIDICHIKNRSHSVSDITFPCHAMDHVGHNYSVVLPITFLCDGQVHCNNAEDEHLPQCIFIIHSGIVFYKKEIYIPALSLLVILLMVASVHIVGKVRERWPLYGHRETAYEHITSEETLQLQSRSKSKGILSGRGVVTAIDPSQTVL